MHLIHTPTDTQIQCWIHIDTYNKDVPWALYCARLCVLLCTLHKMDKWRALVVFDCSARKSYHIRSGIRTVYWSNGPTWFTRLSPMASLQFDLDVRDEKTRGTLSPTQSLNIYTYKSLARKSNSFGVKV